jgi:hypothetical protein
MVTPRQLVPSVGRGAPGLRSSMRPYTTVAWRIAMGRMISTGDFLHILPSTYRCSSCPVDFVLCMSYLSRVSSSSVWSRCNRLSCLDIIGSSILLVCIINLITGFMVIPYLLLFQIKSYANMPIYSTYTTCT